MTAEQKDHVTDQLLEDARQAVQEPSPELLARVLQDAQSAQAGFAAPMPKPVAAVPWWRGIAAALGGAPGLAGLAAATVAGVWIGYSPPEALDDVAAVVLGYDALADEWSSDFTGFDEALIDG